MCQIRHQFSKLIATFLVLIEKTCILVVTGVLVMVFKILDIINYLKNRILTYKILERNGKFLVGTIEKKRKWLFGKVYEKFKCSWKGIYQPAHFDTLKEAREFIKLKTKPDVYHQAIK